jgi:hypothetical protein
MPGDTPGIGGRSASNSGRSRSDYKSSVTRSPAGLLDGRSATGKRVRDLFRALMTRWGDPDDVVPQADIMALAELKTAAETARARLLEGKDQSSNECVRLENLVRRAEARVGLEPGATTKAEGTWEDLFVEDQDEEQLAGDTEGTAP